ncbi:hypothetical protein K501DRAFT_261932 [Backusella circina FSU 941]|nr:hypothetical protein K501DRAFT_261932 [Backusella circina FSU 941]
MFDAPPSTLCASLEKILDNPKEYLADILFHFPSGDIHAHRALLLCRIPSNFVDTYIPQLKDETKTALDISDIISQELFEKLIRFWYTSTFPNDTVAVELDKLAKKLGTPVLPVRSDSVPDSVQLASDLKNMLNDHTMTDITIELVSSMPNHHRVNSPLPSLLSTSPDNHIHPIDLENTSFFTAHRFMLAARSSYFYNMFCTEFQEAFTPTIHLTNDLFNESITDLILTYLYTGKIIVKPLMINIGKKMSPLQHRVEHKKHTLRVIQKSFYAVDYLGESNTLGKALLHEIEELCHSFKCVCNECAVLLPSMLAWSEKHHEMVPKLKRTLVLLYSDPVHSLANLWSQRPFAHLIQSIVPSASALGEETLTAVMNKEPLFRARPSKTSIHEIEERMFCNITKHNAIHVLHSLHLCLIQIRSADPSPSWSRPTLDLVNPVLQYTVSMVSQFFDFYCVEYPILLSCVDGIGGGFSVDFLDFLLKHVLNEGLQETNAGVIYQGIVRDMVGRQEVVNNMAVDDVLVKARGSCANYIFKNWTRIKTQGSLLALEKSTLRQLAEDTGIPYRSLTRPFDSDFANIFSFKPKHKQKKTTKNDQLTQVYTRRLSIGNLMTRSLTHNGNEPTRSSVRSRPRALSTESAVDFSFRIPESNISEPKNQSLINMLAYETRERGRQLEEKQVESDNDIISGHKRPMLRTSSSFDSLTDQLLPLEGLPHIRNVNTAPESLDRIDAPRPSRLKFELPKTPSRSKSPAHNHPPPSIYLTPQPQKNRRGSKTGRRSRWSIGSSDVSDEEPEAIPAVGDKVELLRRPLPTMGTIKYIGPVEFANGTHVGIELESRLGKSDGSIDGVRYFRTDPQRGLFIKPGDFKILSH